MVMVKQFGAGCIGTRQAANVQLSSPALSSQVYPSRLIDRSVLSGTFPRQLLGRSVRPVPGPGGGAGHGGASPTAAGHAHGPRAAALPAPASGDGAAAAPRLGAHPGGGGRTLCPALLLPGEACLPFFFEGSRSRGFCRRADLLCVFGDHKVSSWEKWGCVEYIVAWWLQELSFGSGISGQ